MDFFSRILVQHISSEQLGKFHAEMIFMKFWVHESKFSNSLLFERKNQLFFYNTRTKKSIPDFFHKWNDGRMDKIIFSSFFLLDPTWFFIFSSEFLSYVRNFPRIFHENRRRVKFIILSWKKHWFYDGWFRSYVFLKSMVSQKIGKNQLSSNFW